MTCICLMSFHRIIYFKSAIVKISIKHEIYRKKFGDFRKIVYFCTQQYKSRLNSCVMEKNSEKYDITAFEDEGFVNECLDEFDANVAKVEAE